MQISRDQLQDLTEAFEDTAAHVADQHKLSGECVWTCAGCLSHAKVAEIRGEVTSS
tara:strand:- start:2184 stop:2351 length:168 start_codon:yes stop_codon:yes gene_type:complete